MSGTAPRGVHALARAEPDRPAIVHDGRTVSFGELDATANRLAHALAHRVAPGDRVAVLLHNRPEVFAVWGAVARLGALVVPISYRSTAPEARYVALDSGAVALVHDDGRVAGPATLGIDVEPVDVDDAELQQRPTTPPRDDYLGSPVVWMNYTSGTTGRPKGIVRPAPVPMSDAPPQPYLQFWGFGRDDVHLLTGPAYHTAPGAYAQMQLVEGALVVIMSRFDAEGCLRLIDQHRVTNSHMVPANFVRILELPADVRARYDLSSVRTIIHAAAPCPEAVKRAIIDVFPTGAIWEYYGASEGMGTVISPDDWLAHPGSVGRAFPGIDIRILDEDGEPVPAGTVGHIYISAAKGYAPSYHNAPDKTEQAWRGDRFTVGDLGALDRDGYLYIADRRTDLILRGGVNVYPAEVESALAEHADVVDSAVLGLPDERLGQRVHALVELTPGSRIGSDELRAFLAERLADVKRPTSYEFIAELPREPNGKVNKAALRAERS